MNIRDFFWAFMDLWVESNKGSDPTTYDQCVDLWRAYNRKVIRAPDIFGNPPDIWEKYQADFYERIPNTPEGVPRLGDVIIWGKKYSKYGHIAICTEIADTKKFISFDQNDPIGTPCHFQEHNYVGVLGWLRPKNQENIQDKPPEPPPPPVTAGMDAQIQGYQEFIDKLVEILRPSMDKRDFAGILGVAQETKLLADSIPDLKAKHEEFVKVVAENISCPEASEEAVLKVLRDLQGHIAYIKTQRLEEFGALERIISGIRALLRKR